MSNKKKLENIKNYLKFFIPNSDIYKVDQVGTLYSIVIENDNNSITNISAYMSYDNIFAFINGWSYGLNK